MRLRRLAPLLATSVALLLGACTTDPKAVVPIPARASRVAGRSEEGIASWHGPGRFSRQSRTASGRKWINSESIAAHKTWPLGTMVRVTNKRNGRNTTVQIIDRGPYVRGRVIDLSPRAAEDLGFKPHGIAYVRIEAMAKE